MHRLSAITSIGTCASEMAFFMPTAERISPVSVNIASVRAGLMTQCTGFINSTTGEAIERGLAKSKSAEHGSLPLAIKAGWETYLSRCEDPEILGGVSPATRQRYVAVRDKHLQFCDSNDIVCWSQIDKQATNNYGRWLAKTKLLADRTIVLELNLVCSVVKWLVEENYLPPQCRFLLKLSKPDGTTTFATPRTK